MRVALGLMSGTSMDGIDLAVVRSDGAAQVERGPSHFVAYPTAVRRRIESGLLDAKSIGKRDERPGDLAALERDLTLLHADAAAVFRKRHPEIAIDLVGFHGQTVLHRPAGALTVQIGDGQMLSDRTGLPVVYDMRANDMVHGGQGAPLVPAYHAALAKTLEADRFPVCFVNIGGISNVTYVPIEGEPIAFDSGPGNALIDQWVLREGGIPFDADGVIASEGGIVASVVARYLENPFFAKSGPKSLDRLDFTLDEVDGLELSDGARTLAAVSAKAILAAARNMPVAPKTWIVCGGGRKNPHIVGDIRMGASTKGADVLLAENAGFDGDAMEAEAWAYLAIRAEAGLPLTYPGTTGCREPVTGGVLVRPAKAG